MKGLTLIILTAFIIMCAISYPPKLTNAQADSVKVEAPLTVIKNNQVLIDTFVISNDVKAKQVLENLQVIDSLNRK